MSDNQVEEKEDIPVEYQFRLLELCLKMIDYTNMFDTLITNNRATNDDKIAYINGIKPLVSYCHELYGDGSEFNPSVLGL